MRLSLIIFVIRVFMVLFYGWRSTNFSFSANECPIRVFPWRREEGQVPLQRQPTDLARSNFVVRRDLRSSNYLTNMAFGGLDIGKRRAANVLLHLVFHKNARQESRKAATVHFRQTGYWLFNGSLICGNLRECIGLRSPRRRRRHRHEILRRYSFPGRTVTVHVL